MCDSSKDDFYSINPLEIAYADFQLTTVIIYANGNNQVAVMVRVRSEDQNGSPFSIPEGVVKNVVYLCNFNGGEKFAEVDANGNTIPGNETKPTTAIQYSRTRNDYCNVVAPL